jgi:hypothetical protein
MLKNLSHSIIFGFKEILTWNTMRYIMLSGILVSIFWGSLGFVFWNDIISLGAKLVEMLPFSVVRSDGAWMLSTFVWFQMTLMSFAIIIAFGGNFILRKVSKERYPIFTFLILFLSALFWGIVWFIYGDYIHNQLLKFMSWLPFETLEKSLAFLIGFYIIYNAVIVTTLFLTSMFSRVVIEDIEKREFGLDGVVRDNLFKTVKFTIKDSLIFMLISLLALPVLLVPILNIVVQVSLWIWLFKDTISYDALALTHKDVDKRLLREYKKEIFIVSSISVMFNFIPILNLFGAFFGTITMFHYLKYNIKG